MSRIVDVVRWFVLAVAGLGLVMACLGWMDARRISDVEANGIETTAAIGQVMRDDGNRSKGPYILWIAWQDARGQPRRVTAVHISTAFASQITRDGRLTPERIRIKYLPDSGPQSLPVIPDDAGRYDEQDAMIKAGLIAGAVGIIGSGLFFVAVSRRRKRLPATKVGS